MAPEAIQYRGGPGKELRKRIKTHGRIGEQETKGGTKKGKQQNSKTLLILGPLPYILPNRLLLSIRFAFKARHRS